MLSFRRAGPKADVAHDETRDQSKLKSVAHSCNQRYMVGSRNMIGEGNNPKSDGLERYQDKPISGRRTVYLFLASSWTKDSVFTFSLAWICEVSFS